MDKKILRLTLVIAVSLFWGTAFTGCSDEEDTPAALSTKEGGYSCITTGGWFCGCDRSTTKSAG